MFFTHLRKPQTDIRKPYTIMTLNDATTMDVEPATTNGWRRQRHRTSVTNKIPQNLKKLTWWSQWRYAGTDWQARRCHGRWIGRCFIKSKNDGGKIFSGLHSVTTINWSNFSTSSFKISFEQISLHNLLNSNIVVQIPSSRWPRK